MSERSKIGGCSAVPEGAQKPVLKSLQVPQDHEGVSVMGDVSAVANRAIGIPQFSTSNLAVAAFLTAGKHLALNRVEFDREGIANFVFEDPERKGEQLEAGFLTEDAVVPGAQFHRQLRVLRRLIDERSKQHHFTHKKRGYDHEEESRRF